METRIVELQISPQDMKSLLALKDRWHEATIQKTILHCIAVAEDWTKQRDGESTNDSPGN